MSDPVLLTERRGSVLVATLNRPAKGNALNRPLSDAIDAMVTAVEATVSDPEGPRAVVLTGAGTRAFSAGADVRELDGIDGPTARWQMRHGQRVFDRLEQLPVVVVAAINGFALGGGLELAMACDIRLAAPTARLGQPEITLENLPGWGGTQRLPRLVGRGRATELILTGDLLTADQAEACGLVNHVTDDVVAAAVALAERIAVRNPTAVRGAKRAIDAGLRLGMNEGLRVEANEVAACCQTDAQRAAVRAFLNRRNRK